ncbi:MAG TPA: hypothetical protein VFR86_30650 [Burkholderiaceae bacterium]|nr:hypothetical protein [Burkholderiaceae bacterium]
MKRLQWIAAAALFALLAACGGGSSGNDPGTPAESQMQREDREASASLNGLMAFAAAFIASMTSDQSEPRSITGISPPVSDSAEPHSL